ncbi:MAG: biotin--[acetyl-CoA-carboxylase] ligase [Arenimonas sp.]
MNDVLNRESIERTLGAAARAQVRHLSVVQETVSTQTDALAAPIPAQGCAIFLADRQTSGSGRRGRHWVSPPSANLYMSVSRHFTRAPAALSGLSQAVGVALAEAINAAGLCGATRVGVKWPNDLVVKRRKLGGILIELRPGADSGTDAVIGIGVNVRMPPDAAVQIDQPWCDLSQIGAETISRNALAAALLDSLIPALAEFDSSGLSAFASRWQALDSTVGKPVCIVDGTRTHEGIALGITDAGALRVAMGGAERAFHGGEVSLRSA